MVAAGPVLLVGAHQQRSPLITTVHHRVVIIGGGNAGIPVAARLKKAGVSDVAIIEASSVHYYQPLWTLVGGGCAPARESMRSQASVLPADVAWIRDRAEGVDPDNKTVTTTGGAVIGYDHLVVSPGVQLDGDTIPGIRESMDSPNVCSDYTFEAAPKTWDLIRNLRKGTALFTMPAGPIKCAGAPRRSPTSPRTTGASRACWPTSGSFSCCRPRPCSGCRCSPRSSNGSWWKTCSPA